jgi:nitrogen fixation protein NifU and related proteins
MTRILLHTNTMVLMYKQIFKETPYVTTETDTINSQRKMLSEAGYADPAITYFLEKKYMGFIPDASQVSEKVGSCGDIMKVYLKVDDNHIVQDVRYEITGCAGAISAAMAAVDLIKGRSLDQALAINDGDVFKRLENIPEKKHHCIQLAVKTMHQAVQEYKAGNAG